MQKLISYAQNFEDIMLWRALSHVQQGCYIDIGAQSPDTDSVSRLFHEKGWRGLHVEPTPGYANLLRERRPEEVVLQVAVSDGPGVLRFFDIADTGLSTLSEAIAEEHRQSGFHVSEISVPTITLDTVLEQFSGRQVHWLKIDVEGAEAMVIEGWRESSLRPWILLVESTRPLSSEQTHTEWEAKVLEKGYRFAYFDGLNRFYVSNEHLELLSAFDCGPNVFDNFSLSAASMFCGEVNLAYHALQVHTDQKIAERDRLVHAQENVLIELREALAGSEAEHATAINELSHAQNEALQQLKEAHAEREAEHVLAINAVVQAQHRALGEHAKMIELATGRSQREMRAVKADLAAARMMESELREEAHRWWREAERLHAAVASMENSRSWQLTRPLRAVRRRLSGGMLAAGKRALRPVVAGSLKVVFRIPGLRRLLKPVVVRIPFLYDRLFAMAYDRGLFASSSGTALGGRERQGKALHLDAKAQKVLVDLQVACAQGARK